MHMAVDRMWMCEAVSLGDSPVPGEEINSGSNDPGPD
jgi:hypothetical protein